MTEQPWIAVQAQMADHVMALTGIPAKKFYQDAKTIVDATAQVADYYNMDMFAVSTDLYNFEAEGLGAKMIYGDNSMPTIDHREPLIREPGDLYKLKTPDFYRDGRLLFAMDCIRLTKEKEKGLAAGRFCGPFSLAVGLRSFPALIKDMRKRPEFVRELLIFIVDEVLLPYLKVQKEYCGITVAGGANAWATAPNLSVSELKEWTVPYSRRLVEKAGEIGIVANCIDGDYNEERLEKFSTEILYGCFDVQIATQGSPAIFLGMGRWQDLPLQPILDYTARYRSQGIGIPVRAAVNAHLVRNGPADAIVDFIKRYITTFAPEHEISIGLANIPADTNPDHVHAAVAAIHTYGRKPIAENLDGIEFRMPKRESFQEWKQKGLKSFGA
jgi:uroporphyrinogen-III decarboxylase